MNKATTLYAIASAPLMIAILGNAPAAEKTEKANLHTEKQKLMEVIFKNSKSALREDQVPMSPAAIKSVDKKTKDWFIDHVGQLIYVASFDGFNGYLKVVNNNQALHLYVTAQKAGYKFCNIKDREQQRSLPPEYPIMESIDNVKFLESFYTQLNTPRA